jgi:predicted metal-dependent peptidase
MDSTQLKRVEKQIVEIILSHPFFASLLLRLKVSEDNSQPTFCTDGTVLLYNSEFTKTLPDDHIRGVLAHEVMHPALGHPWRVGHRNIRLCNQAADHVVNLFLNEYNATFETPPFPLPKGALCDPRFAGMGMEEIYTVLNAEQVDGSGRVPSDDPTYGEFKEDNGNKGGGQQKESEWGVAVVQAAQAAKMMGKAPGCLARLASGAVKPTVPWTTLLRRFVTESAADDYDWLKPDRRYLPDFYLPDLQSDAAGELVFAIDTSGSIPDTMLQQFLAEAEEVLAAVRPRKLVTIQCDARVQEVAEFVPGDRVVLKLKGGGGTRFAPIFEEIAQRNLNPMCVVVLTDLKGSFPDTHPHMPVLWASYGDQTAPFGEVIRVNT